jgi:hypothetical protein
LLISVQRWLIRRSIQPLNQLVILLAVVLLTPLPALVISGMEYPTQLLFTFLFITSFSELTGRPLTLTGRPFASTGHPIASTGRPLARKVYVYAILMLAASYATLPILGIAAILLLTRHQWWEAAKLIFFSILPLYLFGLLSVTKHNLFVPTPFFLDWGLHFPAISDSNQLAAAFLLLILALLAAIYREPIRRHPSCRDILWLLAGATACHLFFAPSSAYPHYIAYLTGCTVALGGVLVTQHQKKWLLYPVPVLLALPLLYHAVTSMAQTAPSCVDTYTKQYQTAKFLSAFYAGDPVASTDLGAISFVDDSRIVDLSGLANSEVFDRKRIRNWTPASADSLSERMNANVAILHHSWSDADMEPYWYRIATWQTPTDSISFYSIDRRYIQKLETTMHAFEPQLPPGVVVHYFKPIELQ